jgi:FMN phosphatase YigB (HAD superfamily)
MTFHPRDTRLDPAFAAIKSRSIKLLTLDVFDTLLGRIVPAPTDVFLYLGRCLQAKGLLGTGLAPDSFAAIRYQTEHAVRATQQTKAGNREVTLTEIYTSFPPHALRLSAEEAATAEIAVEHVLCFADTDIIDLAKAAHAAEIRVALVSNSYLPEFALTNLIRTKAPTLPPLDGIFVSCQHRMGKADGLLQKVLNHFGVAAADALHIGDNPKADRDVANRLGLPCIYFDQTQTRFEDEHPIQWHDRADLFTGAGGDGGFSWLRRKAAFWSAETETAHFRYGAQHIGPLLTGFAAWAAVRLQQDGGAKLFGLMREGQVLGSLVRRFGVDATDLYVNRLLAARASFAPTHPEHLQDFLTRRGAWTLGQLFAQMRLPIAAAAPLGGPDTPLADFDPATLTRQIMALPIADDLHAESQALRSRLLAHLKTTGALDQNKLFLLDLGYAGTIQRGLQRILKLENIPITTHGLYLAAAHVSLETQKAGGIVEGFLAQNGNPNDFARAFCRSPEVIELATMPPCGTVQDYAPDGTPCLAADTTPARQKTETAALQAGIYAFADRITAMAAAPMPDPTSNSVKAQMRALATRIALYPTAEEANLVGQWEADSDLGLASPRPILSAGPHEHLLHRLSAAELIALPRRDLPWLSGVATRISPARVRQIAGLQLRRERAEAFDEAPPNAQ